MKRILAIMLAFVVVLSSMVIPVYSADKETLFTENQLDLLVTLGVIGRDYATKYYENELTRGSFAYYIRNFTKISQESATEFEAIYKDITSEHKYFAAIKAVTKAGYMNGYTNGRFGPDDSIPTKDAATVILRTLGYKPYIKAVGLNAAIMKSGVMEGVENKDKTLVQDFVVMIYNALHAPAFRMTAVNDNDTVYDFSDTYIGIEHLYNLKYKRGIVDGAVNTGLIMPDDTMLENMISIDGVRYEYDGNSTVLLGYNVDFYYKDNVENKMGNRKIVLAQKNASNDEIQVKAVDVIGFSQMTISYYQGNNEKKIAITPFTNVIYNGIACSMYEDETFSPDSGSVKFLDNNSDGAYDVVFVESYQYILVDSVDITNEVIYDQNGIDKIELKDADGYTINWTGDDFTLDRIIKGNLLKIKATNPDSGYYSVDIEIIKNERSNAQVENVSKDTLYAGGAVYELWHKLDADSKKALTVGSFVTLYFDGNMVVRVVGGGDGTSYGYLADIDFDGEFTTTVKAMIVDAITSEAQILTLNKRVMIDGNTTNATAVTTPLQNAANSLPAFIKRGTIAQPIKYKLNAKGDIISIDTHIMDAKEDSKVAFRINAYENAKYSGNHTGFSHSGLTHLGSFSSTSPKLRVPDDVKDASKYCQITSPSAKESFNGYKIALCNLDPDTFIADAVYFFLSDDEYNNTVSKYGTPMVIVKDIITEINEDGEIVKKVTCRGAGVDIVYSEPVAVWDEFPAFDIGDLIRIEKDVNDKITKIDMKFDVSEGMPTIVNDEEAGRWRRNEESGASIIPMNYGYRAYWVTPLIIKDGIMRVCMSSKDDVDGFDKTLFADNIKYDKADIYKYSTNRGMVTLEPATITDIITNSMNSENPSELLINIIGSTVRTIVIFD